MRQMIETNAHVYLFVDLSRDTFLLVSLCESPQKLRTTLDLSCNFNDTFANVVRKSETYLGQLDFHFDRGSCEIKASK